MHQSSVGMSIHSILVLLLFTFLIKTPLVTGLFLLFLFLDLRTGFEVEETVLLELLSSELRSLELLLVGGSTGGFAKPLT